MIFEIWTPLWPRKLLPPVLKSLVLGGKPDVESIGGRGSMLEGSRNRINTRGTRGEKIRRNVVEVPKCHVVVVWKKNDVFHGQRVRCICWVSVTRGLDLHRPSVHPF